MEIKNGIIIDGVLHKLVSIHDNDPCSHCSLHEKFNPEERFVICGKVTVTPYYRETPKNAGEIIKNR